MKNIIKTLSTIILLIAFSFTIFACNNTNNNNNNNNPTDDGSSQQQQAIEVTNNDEFLQALESVQSGQIINVNKGNYSSVTINETAFPLNIVAEDEVQINGVYLNSGVSNVTLENFNFTGFGIDLKLTDTITIKKCSFFGNSRIENSNTANAPVKNLVVDGCTFMQSGSDKTTAIKLYRYENLTVKNCTFDTVLYNALQVGNSEAKGEVSVYNNVFDNIGSRVLYFVNLSQLTSCNIYENTFYDNSDAILYEGEDDDGFKKANGVYVHTQSTAGNLVIGVNTWQIVPELEAIYLPTFASYDASKQITMP